MNKCRERSLLYSEWDIIFKKKEKMIKKFLKLFLLAFCGLNVYSQNSAGKTDLPKITLPSPDVTAFNRYGTMPVNYETGVPNISIPLFEVKTTKFSLPISLSYHAGGNKVEDMSSFCGLGWTLNSGGGSISRTVIGRPDEVGGTLTNKVANASTIYSETGSSLCSRVDAFIDNESDEYNFSANGVSGKFVLDTNLAPFLIPYQPLDISLTAKRIIDVNGIEYLFEADEHTNNPNAFDHDQVTAWHVTKMISADKTDTIYFTYEQKGTINQYFYSYSQRFGGNFPTPQNALLESNQSYTIHYPKLLTKLNYKNGEVRFYYSSGRKDVLGGSGYKIDSMVVYSVKNGTITRLKNISFYQGFFSYNNGAPIDQGDYTQHRLKLDSISVFGNDNSVKQTYSFEYNPQLLPPRNSKGKDLLGYYNGQDSNQTTLIDDSYVMDFGIQTPYRPGNRDSYENFMKACVIKKINYPTGGYTEFEFEANNINEVRGKWVNQLTSFTADAIGGNPNANVSTETFTMDATRNVDIIIEIEKYGYPGVTMPPKAILTDLTTEQTLGTYQSTTTQAFEDTITFSLTQGHTYELKAEAYQSWSVYSSIWAQYNTPQYQETSGPRLYGGLRVKTIKAFQNNLLTSMETYKYGDNESGIGTLVAPDGFIDNNKRIEDYNPTPGQPVKSVTFTSHSLFELGAYNGAQVLYSTVTKYDGPTPGQNGKSIYKYDIFRDSVMYLGGGTKYNGKNYWPTNKNWKNGNLKEELDFNYNGSVYDTVKRTTFLYDYIPSPNLARGLKVFLIPYDWQPPGGCVWLYAETESLKRQFYNAFNYPICSGTGLLKQKTEILYGPNANDTLTSNYTYDNMVHIRPTRIETLNSKGEKLSSETKYSTDYTGLTATDNLTAGIKNLGNRHIIVPIEQRQYLMNADNSNSRLIASSFTSFNNSQPVVDAVYNIENASPVTNFTVSSVQSGAVTKDANYKKQIQFNSYDAFNNIREMQKTNNIKQSFIWGYNNQYPIAAVVNATVSDIFHTSFEDNDGNSADKDCKTGSKSRTGGYSKSLSGLSNGSYILSYWQKSGSTWSLQSSSVTVSGNAYTINLTGQVDEVRFYPSTAQMTTYTYDLQVGITSQTDVNNKTMYYIYDGFGRLSLIRDQDNNILKKFNYKYIDQPGIITYYNVQQSGQFTRSNCGSGYLGSTVTYTVPAGTYSASSQLAADQLALNDVTTNGQAYANTNGSCIATSCSFTPSGNWNNYSSTVTPGGTSVTVTLVISGKYSSSFNNITTSGVVVGNISGSCRPNVTKSLSYSASGRTWAVMISPGGDVILRLTSGTVPSVGQQLQFNSLNYSLQ